MSKIENLTLPVSGATAGGVVGGTNAAQSDSFIFRLIDSGVFDMFSDWSRTDTYAVMGLVFTAISIYQTAQVIKLRRQDANSR